MQVKSESEVAQSCPTLSDLMNCSLPGSSIHGIFQARVLKWAAITFSLCVLDNLGFHGGSDGKESACNAGDLDLIPELGRSPGEGLPTPVFWPGELHGLCSPWGLKEWDTTEDFHFHFL